MLWIIVASQYFSQYFEMIQNSVTCRYSSGNDNEASQEENDGFHFGGFSSEKTLKIMER